MTQLLPKTKQLIKQKIRHILQKTKDNLISRGAQAVQTTSRYHQTGTTTEQRNCSSG